MADQAVPHNLLLLSFEHHDRFLTYVRNNNKMLEQIWLWHETLGNRDEPLQLPGLCDICECSVTFTAKAREMPEGDRFPFRVSWWSSLVCDCKMTTLDRAVLRVFLD